MRAELDTLWARVRLEITSIWQTEEHPREGLTVADEREHVLFYLIEILYRVVPLFYEEIEGALARAYGVTRRIAGRAEHPAASVPGWAATWTATPMFTARPSARPCTAIGSSSSPRYFNECGQLAEALSQSASRVEISAALAERIDAYTLAAAGGAGARAGAPRPHALPDFLRPGRRAPQGDL